jgi:hypothetical protein
MQRTLIHNAPAFALAATVTNHSAGRTVELHQMYPLATYPRWQRTLCLTLPAEAFAALGGLFTDAAHAPLSPPPIASQEASHDAP